MLWEVPFSQNKDDGVYEICMGDYLRLADELSLVPRPDSCTGLAHKYFKSVNKYGLVIFSPLPGKQANNSEILEEVGFAKR